MSETPDNTRARRPERGSSYDRNATIDLLRIVAIFGVIWFHSEATPYKRIGYAGLVFFLIVAVVFQLNSATHEKFGPFLQKRAQRLLIPWLVWFIFYAAFNAVAGKKIFPHTSGFFASLLGGPWIGLWYLPFSFLTAALVFGISRYLYSNKSDLILVFYSVASILALTGVSVMRASGIFAVPWAQWLQAFPSIPLGMTLAVAFKDPREPEWKVATVLGCILATCAYLYSLDPGMAVSYGIGSILVAIGLKFKRSNIFQVNNLSSLCFGAYLIHGAVMSGLKAFSWMTQHYLYWFVATTFLSFAAIFIMKRTPPLARIV